MDFTPAQRKWEALPPEKSDVGTVESIYDLFKPNKRPLTYAEYKMLRSQGKIFIDPMSGCIKVIDE